MTVRHLHLDAVGGVAGDMFVAALLHAYPEHAAAATHAAAVISGVACSLVARRDDVLAGAAFAVEAAPRGRHDHTHHHWRDIRRRLEAADMAHEVRCHAIGIFTQLAEAEGRVHGLDPDAVAFHEVGNADSIADIVASAWMIAAMGEARWSVGPIPLGSGLVTTAHGQLPIPAPAVALLLEGFDVVDDGLAGERVTPTGAAILRHLGCAGRAGLHGRMARTGIGFGTRTLRGRSNVLRVLVFETAAAPAGAGHRELAVITFEVDDQSAEELSAGLDRLRGLAGVHDVLQMAAFAKKGRMATHVQVLVRPDALDAATEACFHETTTIGLRTHVVQGRALARTARQVTADGREVRVKLVDRPGGISAKAEADDALGLDGHQARATLRRRAETIARNAGDA